MKRFAIGFVIGLLFAGLVVVILSFAALNIGEKKVTVADGSTLVLHLEAACLSSRRCRFLLHSSSSSSP